MTRKVTSFGHSPPCSMPVNSICACSSFPILQRELRRAVYTTTFGTTPSLAMLSTKEKASITSPFLLSPSTRADTTASLGTNPLSVISPIISSATRYSSAWHKPRSKVQ
uniref:Uncharacterized protein n=1 Tax=Opuntia streptacantha TaxID=393608 RepID=A0A7C9AN99_OPUST